MQALQSHWHYNKDFIHISSEAGLGTSAEWTQWGGHIKSSCGNPENYKERGRWLDDVKSFSVCHWDEVVFNSTGENDLDQWANSEEKECQEKTRPASRHLTARNLPIILPIAQLGTVILSSSMTGWLLIKSCTRDSASCVDCELPLIMQMS